MPSFLLPAGDMIALLSKGGTVSTDDARHRRVQARHSDRDDDLLTVRHRRVPVPVPVHVQSRGTDDDLILKGHRRGVLAHAHVQARHTTASKAPLKGHSTTATKSTPRNNNNNNKYNNGDAADAPRTSMLLSDAEFHTRVQRRPVVQGGGATVADGVVSAAATARSRRGINNGNKGVHNGGKKKNKTMADIVMQSTRMTKHRLRGMGSGRTRDNNQLPTVRGASALVIFYVCSLHCCCDVHLCSL
jgi:hypothetical protein